MSSSQTANFGLNQWAANDYVIREEFNEDNRKIDTELSKITRTATGNYTGNGKYGSANPNSLTFPFAPKLVIIQPSGGGAYGPMFVRNGVTATAVNYHDTAQASTITWSNGGKTLSWYTQSNMVAYQLNTNNSVYTYIALG